MDLENLKGMDKLASAKVKVPGAATARGIEIAPSSVTFCELWPTVKAGLEVLAKKVPVLAFVVGILVTVGDNVCPG